MFYDDIVDDTVLPRLSLAVDGLTGALEGRGGRLELSPGDLAANEDVAPDTTLPATRLGSEQLEVYGWESSWWRKLKRYLSL